MNEAEDLSTRDLLEEAFDEAEEETKEEEGQEESGEEESRKGDGGAGEATELPENSEEDGGGADEAGDSIDDKAEVLGEDEAKELKAPISWGPKEREEFKSLPASVKKAIHAREQEVECDFEAAVKGTYYADIIQKLEGNGRIASVLEGGPVYDPILPVNVSSDLGYTDSCSWWFWQDTAEGPRIIDYYEEHSKPLQHYFDMLRSKGYTYGTIWLPHDAKAKTLQTGKSTIEQFLEEDFPVNIVPRLSRQHGIDAARKVLPACRFNKDLCYDGIEALRAYRRQYNELTKAFSDSPLHDWSSNGSDAFRYLALVCQESMGLVGRDDLTEMPLLKKQEFKLEDLFKEREGRSSHRYEKLRI